MTLHITYCEMDGGIVHRYAWHDGDETDVRSYNVVADYEEALEDGHRTFRETPKGHPYFDILVHVHNSHKVTSEVKVDYRRLDTAPRYNESVAEIMEFEYSVIKANHRKGMLAWRNERKEVRNMACKKGKGKGGCKGK